ncbi:hypothetical protein HWV62_41076 [Athelia sp. TMB]|nr:hypothetical protein HWV62_41076 [Athelia sp. TMB]
MVRVGPNELSTNRADCTQPILGTGGLVKGECWYNRVPPGTPTSLVSIRMPAVHKSRRRVWDLAFSATTIRDYWKWHLMRRVGQLVEHLGLITEQEKSGAKAVVDLNNWMSSFTYDIMGDITFGGGFEMMKTGGDTTGMTEALQGFNTQHAILAHIPWAHTYVRLIPFAAAAGKRFAEIALAPLITRITEGTQVKDLFWFLADEESPEPPSRATVKADGIMAIVAGSDTTATTLTAMWYFLLRNPEIMQRLEEEVDSHFTEVTDPWGEDAVQKMSTMMWLNSIICIPEGTQVTSHTYSLQRNPLYFSLPDVFLPQRWHPREFVDFNTDRKFHQHRDDPTSNPGFNHDPTAFHPFSTGPANCAGRAFAILELRAVVCAVVWRFRFLPLPGVRLEEWEESLEDYFIVRRGRLDAAVECRH